MDKTVHGGREENAYSDRGRWGGAGQRPEISAGKTQIFGGCGT